MRSITRSSSRSPRLRACTGDRFWSKITRSTSLWKARITQILEAAGADQELADRAAARCWVTTSTTSTPAECASSRSSSSCSRVVADGRAGGDRDQDRALARADGARAVLARELLLASADPVAEVELELAPAAPASGARCRAVGVGGQQRRDVREAGQPVGAWSRSPPSRRAAAARGRSGRRGSSGSSPRCVCRQRRPRRRPRPARRRPQSGISMRRASPTIDVGDLAARSTSTPTWRPVSRVSARELPGELLGDQALGRQRRRKQALEPRSWLALRPWVLPRIRMVAPCLGRWSRPGIYGTRLPRRNRGRDSLGGGPTGRSFHSERPSTTLTVADASAPAPDGAEEESRMGATPRELAVLLLAAGKGTRMKSAPAKVLHPICGRPMLAYPARGRRGAPPAAPDRGGRARRRRGRRGVAGRAELVLQSQQRGTGHAVLQPRARSTASAATCWCSTATRRCCAARPWSACCGTRRRRGADLVLLSAPVDVPGIVVRDARGPRRAHRRGHRRHARRARDPRAQHRRLPARRRAALEAAGAGRRRQRARARST